MKLENLPKTVNRRTRRLGRGHGSGHGKTSGKGHKGQKARKSGGIPLSFEGGQTPLIHKLPYKRGRGFSNFHFKKNYIPVNISDLEKLDSGSKVDNEVLLRLGLIRKGTDLVKLLGNGNISKALNIKVDAYSISAKEKIEQAGGKLVDN